MPKLTGVPEANIRLQGSSKYPMDNHLDLLDVQEIELMYNPKKVTTCKVRGSKDASNLFRKFYDDRLIQYKEFFWIMLLNNSNHAIGMKKISEGGMTGTVVDVRVVMAVALKSAATGMILCHNHPSGALKPSDNDIVLTKKLKEAGQLLSINVLDHVILSVDGYYSFADDGMM